ncbi:Uu.00g084650.m01.CDS01 [Anthostomella pinea]|uniref:Uu.00g084650.m01.CDS01 n=1 Tax=Anthostomella pinea TaxID=933095 RepID=A0AAI8VLT9_9PEZI|nr:Uu.00g084650.m01.CDS01 [Anthostomella pinea]
MIFPGLLRNNLSQHDKIIWGDVLAIEEEDGSCALVHALEYDHLALFDDCLRIIDFAALQASSAELFTHQLGKLIKQCAYVGSIECVRHRHRKFPRPTKAVVRILLGELLDGALRRNNLDFARALAAAFRMDGLAEQLGDVSYLSLDSVNSASTARTLSREDAYTHMASSTYSMLHHHCNHPNTSTALLETLITEFRIEVNAVDGGLRWGAQIPEAVQEKITCRTALDYACSHLNVKAAKTLLRLGAHVGGAHAVKAQALASGQVIRWKAPTPLSLVMDQAIDGIGRCPWKHHLDKRTAWCFHEEDLGVPEYTFIREIQFSPRGQLTGCVCAEQLDEHMVPVWLRLVKAFCDRVCATTEVLLAHGAGAHINIPDHLGRLPFDRFLQLTNSIFQRLEEDRARRPVVDGEFLLMAGVREPLESMGTVCDLLIDAGARSHYGFSFGERSGLDRLFELVGYEEPVDVHDYLGIMRTRYRVIDSLVDGDSCED